MAVPIVEPQVWASGCRRAPAHRPASSDGSGNSTSSAGQPVSTAPFARRPISSAASPDQDWPFILNSGTGDGRLRKECLLIATLAGCMTSKAMTAQSATAEASKGMLPRLEAAYNGGEQLLYFCCEVVCRTCPSGS